MASGGKGAGKKSTARAAVTILMLGDSSVGKTSLIKKWSDDAFSMSQLATVGIDYVKKTVKMDGQDIMCQVWDTAGQERFRSLGRAYFKSADAIIVVFDTTQRGSFDTVSRWMDDIMKFSAKSPPVVLVGNKVDLVDGRVVSTAEGTALARTIGARAGFVETSCRSGEGVTDAFARAMRAGFEAKMARGPEPREDTTKLDEKPPAAPCCSS